MSWETLRLRNYCVPYTPVASMQIFGAVRLARSFMSLGKACVELWRSKRTLVSICAKFPPVNLSQGWGPGIGLGCEWRGPPRPRHLQHTQLAPRFESGAFLRSRL